MSSNISESLSVYFQNKHMKLSVCLSGPTCNPWINVWRMYIEEKVIKMYTCEAYLYVEFYTTYII